MKIFNSGTDTTEILIGTSISVLRMNAQLQNLFLSTDVINTDVLVGNDFQIYPVPAKNEIYLNIQNNNILNCSYDLMDINGQIIKSNMQIKNQVEEIDLTGLKSGMYLIGLKTNNSYNIKKFIKE